MDIRKRGETFALLLAAHLKDTVKKSGFTQRKLAEATHTSAAQINMYLNADRVLPVDFYSSICTAINHVVLSTKPIEADASVPKWPTMEASIKNINTVVICARIDGILNSTIKLSFSPRVNVLFSRIFANKASLFLLENIPLYSRTKIQIKIYIF